MTLNVLVVSKGHDYDHDSFIAMFAALDGVEMTLVEQPAATAVIANSADDYDAVFFYDMCGIPGMDLPHDRSGGSGAPSADYASAIELLLQKGTGLVLVNHATVSWANWPLWRQISGSSFMLSAGELQGQQVPGSGYRGGHGPHPNATIKLVPQGTHPVLEGLSNGFDITDELYLKTDLYGPNVLPLLRGDYEFTADNFTAPPLASAEEQASWNHPPGSDLIVWANAAGNSPIVVSDVGDGPVAFDNPDYRTLIRNALYWVASDDAKSWAKSATSA